MVFLEGLAVCDYCDREERLMACTRGSAVKEARASGWRVSLSRGEAICPDCMEEKANEKETA